MSKLNIENNIKEDVEALGYEIEYVEYVKEGDAKILRVVIDKKDAFVTTEACELVSKKIEDKVDNLIKGNEAYILEISSPGLERALKNTRLYNKYMGYKIKIKLYKKVEGLKELVGTLCEVDENKIAIIVEDKKIEIERDNIAVANTVYDFEEELKWQK